MVACLLVVGTKGTKDEDIKQSANKTTIFRIHCGMLLDGNRTRKSRNRSCNSVGNSLCWKMLQWWGQ